MVNLYDVINKFLAENSLDKLPEHRQRVIDKLSDPKGKALSLLVSEVCYSADNVDEALGNILYTILYSCLLYTSPSPRDA